ncbi:MAG: TlpA family protein disulfide reductase [Breznakibacter sp.]|nr:TlpA family protein disulfide reductase [Breznakibacter sp.]
MISRILLICCFLSTSLSNLWATDSDSTTIYGVAPTYAGLHLSLEYLSNPVMHSKSTLVSFWVMNDGTFTATFPLVGTMRVSLNLGQIEGTLILAPGEKYKIELPPFEPLKDEDQLNPFFAPSLLPLAVIEGDKDELNRLVSLFDDEFNSYYVSNVHKLFKKESEKPFLSIMAHLDSTYNSNNEWFNQYRHFTYQKLYELTFQRRKEFVVSRFFKEGSFQPHNPAYLEAFNSSFYRYLSLKFSSTNSEALKKAWQSRSIDSISFALKESTLLVNDSLREAVILKNLYDAYYSDLYDKNEIISLIEKSKESFVTPLNRRWSEEILESLLKLRVGFNSPDFVLENGKGKERSLKKYKGKFVYLNFMDSRNFACKRDLLALQTIHSFTRKELEIVTIFIDRDFDKAREFMKSNKLDWESLSFSKQPSVLADYKIRVFPTYFLIDPEGKLFLSPAPSPEESFLARFQDLARDYKNQDLRKNPPKQKSIFEF